MIGRSLLLGAALLIAAPALAASPVATPITIGQSYTLPSKVLGGERIINVYTPAGYAEGDARYPVVYLIDGGIEQDFHHITGLAQIGGTPWGPMQAVIVVGIETVDRRHELAAYPATDPKLQKEAPTAGGSDQFRRFIADEVKPFVEASYRTNGESGVIGESLAGLFIVETFLKAPDTFDRYIAISPSLWWDNEALSKEAAALIAKQDGDKRSLWLSIADEGREMQSGMDRLVAALKAGAPKSLDWRYEPRQNQTHASIYHGTAYDALRAFYPKPAE